MYVKQRREFSSFRKTQRPVKQHQFDLNSTGITIIETGKYSRCLLKNIGRCLIKQLTGLEKCQCRKARIQSNHIACAILVWVRLAEIARVAGVS